MKYIFTNINNYYNRRLIKYETIQEYKDKEGSSFHSWPGNFDINDEVNATINVSSELAPKSNYFIHTDADENILSRWFIIECRRESGKNWTLTLKRDSLADFKEKILSAPVYIEKGWPKEDSPLAVIKENVVLNQIKTKETVLSDGTSGWIAVYYKTADYNEEYNNPTTGRLIETPITQKWLGSHSFTLSGETNADYSISELSELTGIPVSILTDRITNSGSLYYLNNNDEIKLKYKAGCKLNILWKLNQYFDIDFKFSKGEYFEPEFILDYRANIKNEMLIFDNRPATIAGETPFRDSIKAFSRSLYYNPTYYPKIKELINYYLNENTTEMSPSAILAYQNKTVKIEDQVYRLNFKTRTENRKRTESLEIWNNNVAGLTTTFENAASGAFEGQSEINPVNNLTIETPTTSVITFDCVLELSGNYTYEWKSRQIPGEPYSIALLPLKDITLNANGATVLKKDVGRVTRYILKELMKQLSSQIIDIQIVPYFIYPELYLKLGIIYLEGYIDLQNNSWFSPDNYSLITRDGELYSAIFFLDKNKFEVELQGLGIDAIKEFFITSKYSRKVESNCNFYRLVSPNFQSKFDFNLANNGNSVLGFRIRGTYKPYQPVVFVQPNFKDLYGSNYNDDRGLICSGDFSLSQTNNAWTNYQLNNKMYDKTFSRDIQNLQFTQNQERIQSGWSAATGSITGAATGAVAGSKAGPYGAMIGAAVGGSLSLAGGIADLSMLGDRQKEAVDYSYDKYKMNLANIQALPDIITKISALDYSFRVHPIMEYYTCTDQEREFFENKIYYEGCSFGIIDVLSNYIIEDEEHYFKGYIIRLEDLEADSHLVNDINNELLKGVYL